MGRCPKTPVAGCAGYGLIFDGSPKSIRTAHRIAPKVAAAHLPFPPTPFPDGGKGARMGWQLKTESDALGVLGLAKTVSRKPMVMVSGAGGLQEKGGRSPPPKRGRLGGGRCICDTLLSPSACSTEGFFRRKNAFRIQRSRAQERGLSRGNLSPLTVFC